jgi:RES domain-containing protein
MPLPPGLGVKGSTAVVPVWRLETAEHAKTWAKGIGAFMAGGRWSPKGRSVIYCALDPSTAILEVAVHKGFKVLDTVPHKLLQIGIHSPGRAHVLDVAKIPNKNWLRPGAVSAGQQAYGDALLDKHPFLVVPSVVSGHCYNLVIDVRGAKGFFKRLSAEDFALDTRLHATT